MGSQDELAVLERKRVAERGECFDGVELFERESSIVFEIEKRVEHGGERFVVVHFALGTVLIVTCHRLGHVFHERFVAEKG